MSGLIVVIPAFNEEATILRQINAVNTALKNTTHKVIVVDDGSADNTQILAKKAGAIVISHVANRGLAQAFRTGVHEALKLNADAIVHIDADLQYRAAELPLLIKKLNEGYDLVLGSRFLGFIEGMSIIKRLGNKAFSKVVSGIVGQKITDAQTGFRAFNAGVAKLDIISNYTYTQEQVIKAIKNNFSVTEVPIYFAERRGKSRLVSNSFDYAFKAFITIFRVYRDNAPLKFFGSIGLFLFLIGFLLANYFVFLHFTSGIVGHTALIVLTAILLLSGLQIILFGFLADMRR